ncbi:alpha/beta hydrolase [Herbiconiux sp. L3-i23]|uniref:alpha/beta hydrolase n=1 Tax=Herbiconiux sp. L3-i23 TaxID=2905871 RepID=UPI00204FDA22|nr:alpha/beta hydrolase [Herbiconiux sp. L3-i23]BDI22975.1 esterase [Herbiconiux sp. L3-i23]
MNLSDIDLDPGLRRWIARIEELAPTIPGLGSADPVTRRAADRELSDALAVDFTLPAPESIEISAIELGGRPARRYRSATMPASAPTQLWLHGGGFFAGTPDEILNDRLLARRAADSGIQIFSLDYRLAPEHPYPAAVEDAVAALADLVARADQFGVNPTRLGIGGNSAGAGISASTSLRLRDAGDDTLIHVDLEVPPTATRAVGQSAVDYASGFGLDELETILAFYVGPDGPADRNIGPLDVDDLTCLPPHLIFVAEHDLLRDMGLEYAERLRVAGVTVELVVGEGHLHGAPGITAAFDGARRWQERHAALLQAAYSAGPAA